MATETTTETRAEMNLAAHAEYLRQVADRLRTADLGLTRGRADAIDIGREAIALLARLEPACYNAASWTAWKKDVAALLKRAQG